MHLDLTSFKLDFVLLDGGGPPITVSLSRRTLPSTKLPPSLSSNESSLRRLILPFLLSFLTDGENHFDMESGKMLDTLDFTLRIID